MSVRIYSAAITGIDAQLIEVEVDSTPGLHAFNIVGLPDKSVEESKERIASAIRNNSLIPPSAKHKKIIINLAPADIRKEGPAYDLPIAVGYLLETKQVSFSPDKILFLGELSLDGALKPINGVLSATLLAKESKFSHIVVPVGNIDEAALVDRISVIGVATIDQLISHLNGMRPIKPAKKQVFGGISTDIRGDSFRYIRGQEAAKRALLVSAAGGHNIIMAGPPGSGKTLLARALSDLLPPLSFQEAIEVGKIYSSLGQITNGVLSSIRPYRNPHHTTSVPAMVGGGSNPRPGEISLAHRGVLFMDELPEFPRNVLEGLREPMEDGMITVSRVAGSVRLPAKFTLIGAMNPCPCGNYGDSRATCTCSPANVIRYRRKISGPLLDRIDIQISVPRETNLNKNSDPLPENEFQALKVKIQKARERQLVRFGDTKIINNAEISYKNVDTWCVLDSGAEQFLQKAVAIKGLSLRSYHKIKKIARTIADLEGSETIGQHHVAEALNLRVNEKLLGEFT